MSADLEGVRTRGAARALAMLVSTAFRATPRETIATLALTLVGGVNALDALWLKLLTDGVFRADLRGALVGAVLLAASYLTFTILYGEQSRVRLYLGERTGFELDRRLTELSARLPGLEHHERPEFCDRVQLLRESESGLRHVMNMFLNTLALLVQFTIAVILLASVHPLLALLPLSGIPALVIGPIGQSRVGRAEEQSTEDARLATHLFELATTPGPAKELRVFNLESEILARHDAALRDAWRRRLRAERSAAALDACAYLARGVGLIAAVAFVVVRTMRGGASPGDVAMSLALVQRVTQNLNSLVLGFTRTLQMSRAAARLMWLVDYSAAHEERATVPAPTRIEDGIELRGVSFRYPGTDAWILHDVNLRIPAGACVAIVGDNGAGKTTLVKLLARFYEPTEGAITVDGEDLGHLDHESWRSRVSAAFQDFVRLELVAREAVGVGDLPRIQSVPAVTGALTRAGGSDLVEALPAGLETQLGAQWDGGTDLSLGQWQMLALGRAMMRQAPLLLVLDEPTASLDAQTEHALFERYRAASRAAALANGAITVLVSHRFSTVRIADLIVVVDGGRVIDTGTHDELVSRGGLYNQLYELQARAYR